MGGGSGGGSVSPSSAAPYMHRLAGIPQVHEAHKNEILFCPSLFHFATARKAVCVQARPVQPRNCLLVGGSEHSGDQISGAVSCCAKHLRGSSSWRKAE